MKKLRVDEEKLRLEELSRETAAAKALYKTTIVIWSRADGSSVELVALAQDATDGVSYCSKQKSVLVKDPSFDPEWDGTEFFDQGDEETC